MANNAATPMRRERIHFVTGKLAAPALEKTIAELSSQAAFNYSIQTLPITVAALMTAEWVASRISVPEGTTRVVLPGFCQGDLAALEKQLGVPVERGPKDLRELPGCFGLGSRGNRPEDYGRYDIEIIAEINHAPKLSTEEILRAAKKLSDAGANVIDVGCDPGYTWPEVGSVVRELRDTGHRVSIDSFNPQEVESAIAAGAELVLSVDKSNRHLALDWGCEVVLIPDEVGTLNGLDESIEAFVAKGVPFRVDPIIEPIGFGFAASLGRYLEVRRRYSDIEMMMGIGNLTELTDVDSAGVNVLLLGFCQEAGIRSVLTTEVINWACSSVAECDLARKLMYHAVNNKSLPKHVEPNLVMLRDTQLHEHGPEVLAQMASDIKDRNYRLFAEGEQLHALAERELHSNSDPFVLFEKMQAHASRPIEADHAFYLGYEMAKAVIALQLGKQYRQDQALDWGMLTKEEISHRERKKREGAP